MARSQDNDYLKIGDLVTFKSVEFEKYLCSEGILVEDVFVSNDFSSFDNCLFAIHLQRKYSAFKELNNYVRLNNLDLNNANSLEEQEPTAQKYLQALIRGKDNERALNDTYMRDKTGQCIVFGDIIQLYHVKSRKYVKVLNGKLAKGERENMKVNLDIQGDSYSWFQVYPRYRIDREGDRIPTGSELYLRVVEKPGEFIHCAHRLPNPAAIREVNCALESTSWRASIFQSSLDATDPVTLLCGQLVYINDPEKNANLAIGKNKSIGLDDQSIYAGTPAIHIHDYGDIVLEPTQENKSPSSAALWLLESKKLIVGGPIAWKTQQVRIKNLNTGLYLLSAPVLQTDEMGNSSEIIIWTTTDNFMLPGTLFSVEELLAGANDLGVGRTVKINQKGLYLECSGDIILEDKSYAVSSTREADKAVNFKLFRYVENEDGSSGMSVTVASPEAAAGGGGAGGAGGKGEAGASSGAGGGTSGGSGGSGGAAGAAPANGGGSGHAKAKSAGGETHVANPLDVHVSVAARNFLRQYLHMIRIPAKIKGASSIWPTADDAEFEFFHTVVQKMIWFSQGQPISSTMASDLINTAKQLRRQLLLMEQGLVEVLLRIVHRLTPITQRASKGNNLPEEKMFLESGASVLSRVLGLLLACIKDNSDNQMIVADYLFVLLNHLGSQELAGECVTEMLAKNVDVQENKVTTREIAIFVDKLRESRMNAMYLQLLTACCSCEGNGVDGNQCKVTNMIFEGQDMEDIIIRIKPVEEAERIPHSWSEKSLYIPAGLASMSSESSVLHGGGHRLKSIPSSSQLQQAHAQAVSNSNLLKESPIRGEELLTSLPQLMLTFKAAPGDTGAFLATAPGDGSITSRPTAAGADPMLTQGIGAAGGGGGNSRSGSVDMSFHSGGGAFSSRSNTTSIKYHIRPPGSPSTLYQSQLSVKRQFSPGPFYSGDEGDCLFAYGSIPVGSSTKGIAVTEPPAVVDTAPKEENVAKQAPPQEQLQQNPPSSAQESRPGSSMSTSSYRPRSLPPLDPSASRPGTSQKDGAGGAVPVRPPSSASSQKQQPVENAPSSLMQAATAAADSKLSVTIQAPPSTPGAPGTATAAAPPSSAPGGIGRLSKAVSFMANPNPTAAMITPLFKSGTLDENGYYRYDVLTLFGEMGMDNKDEYSLNNSLASITKSNKAGSGAPPNASNSSAVAAISSSEAATAVANYFVAQVFLGAEMCLDRNYVAMHTLDERFPYEVLVTLVRMNISDKLKAAACRMLLCLHVDRDPQSQSRIPSLSRSWKMVEAFESTEGSLKRLPSVEKPLVNQFALCQEFISEHMASMAGRRWNELSKHMLLLLKKLIYFNFYGTVDKLNDVITHLVKALDRKEAEHEYEVTAVATTGPGTPSAGQRSRGGSSGGRSSKHRSSSVGKPVTPSQHGHDNSHSFVNNSHSAVEKSADDSNSENEFGSHGNKYLSQLWYDRLTRTLEFMESLPVLVFILALVVVAVVLAIYQTVAPVNSDPGSMYYILNNVILAIFILEVSTRAVCFRCVRGTLAVFVCDIFNVIDIAVILIDVVFLCLPTSVGSGGKYAKTLRLIRLLRLLRLFRAARVMNRIGQNITGRGRKDKWRSPLRYIKTAGHEIATMLEAVGILGRCQKIIEDRNLTLLLKQFNLWQQGKTRESPGNLFELVIQQSKDLTLDVNNFDTVFLDLLMFSSNALVQSSLELLMAHHSSRQSLLHNAQSLQLMISPKHESLFTLVDRLLQTLERNAETHELWGELATDSDRQTNAVTIDILNQLIGLARVRRYVFDVDGEYAPDVDTQNLYRNLDCFTICLKVLGLLDGMEDHEIQDERSQRSGQSGRLSASSKHQPLGSPLVPKEKYDEAGLNILKLCSLTNELLYWFFWNNPLNQEAGFVELGNFIEQLEMEEDVGAHLVIESILKNNEKLMRLVPHVHLFELAEKIANCDPADNRCYRDLYLFGSITSVGDINIKENQLEIIKQLCSPGRLPNVSCFFVPADSEEYAMKIELMEPFQDDPNNPDLRDLRLDQLPPLIAYHVMLMTVLSRCTIGRYNVTTVEAKVQSVFKAEYLLEAILDPRTILVVRLKTCQLMLNCMVDVEMQIPGFEFNASIWKFFETINVEKLAYAKDEIRLVEKQGWAEPEVSRHRMEFILVCIQIIGAFFRKYYRAEKFKVMDGAISSTNRVQMTYGEINALIISMFNKCRDAYELDSPRLSQVHKESIYNCCMALNEAAANVIVTDFPATHNARKAAVNNEAYEDPDVVITRKYREFVAALSSDEGVKESIAKEEKKFCTILDELPSVDDLSIPGDVRQQVLFTKLVAHVRENLSFVNRERRLSPEHTRTAIFIIRSFRTIIENRMGMTIAQRDDEGGDEQDEAAAPAIKAMNETGSTALCLDLIAAGLEPELVLESIYLIVAMLFKEGGAIAIQSLIHKHLYTQTDSFLLFKQIRITIKRMIAFHEFNGVVIVPEGEEPKLMDEIIILRFMQLTCEGHYLPNQDIMREQPTNSQQFNLLDDLVAYLNCLSRLHCRTSTQAANAVAAVILEVIQGPCKGNQFYFAMDTDLLEIINRLLRSSVELDCVPEEETELKKTLIDILQGLVEGQSGASAVYDRVISVVHLEIVLLLANGGKSIHDEAPPTDAAAEGGAVAAAQSIVSADADAAAAAEEETEAEVSEEERILRAECMVFINMMCDYRPSLRVDLHLEASNDPKKGDSAEAEEEEDDDSLKELSESTVSVEILWAGDLQRRYFYVPSVCKFIAKTSMDRLVQNVDRSNNEAKLKDFIERLRQMYREVKHQQVLSELRLSSIFNQTNHSRSTWCAFGLACLINFLYLLFFNYATADDVNPDINDNVQIATMVLGIIQLAVACFTLIMSIVVRSPVEYDAQVERWTEVFERKQSLALANSKVKLPADYKPVHSRFTLLWNITLPAVLCTASEGMTVYYIGYVVFAVLAITYDNFFNCLLLLDLVVKNATCKNVLMSVYLPREALGSAALLGVFVLYIYAFFTFYFMPEDVIGRTSNDGYMDMPICNTLWGCFKFYIGQALLAGGGSGDMMHYTLGVRLFNDLSFFIIITIILLSVIFGIIIDTFSALRFAKDEREEITENFCFICGIEKVTFDRAEGSSDGFVKHIKNDHLMWNYMKFIFHIWEQDRDDDDGLEQFVRNCIDKNDITWFPMNKALKLSQAETAMDVLQRELFRDISLTEAQLTENLKNLQLEANVVLSQLKAALKADFGGAGAKVGIGRALIQMTRQGAAARGHGNEGGMDMDDGEGEDDENDDVVGGLDGNGGGAGGGVGGGIGSIIKKSDSSFDGDLGKHIFIAIEAVSGFHASSVSAEELAKVSCCVVCDINMYSVQCNGVATVAGGGLTMVFKMSEPLLICSNAEIGDDRKCLVQVLDMQGIFGMNSFGAKLAPSKAPPSKHSSAASLSTLNSSKHNNTGKCFGKVEFEMDELVAAANTVLIKELATDENGGVESTLKLHIRPSFVVATENTSDI